MRKVVGGLFITIDGVVESPDQWSFDLFDEDFGAHMGAVMASTDTLLLGRNTYQEWVEYWPTSTDEPFAGHMNGVRKYVVSDSLDDVGWNNASLMRGDDLAATIAELKQQAGNNIATGGSPTLVRRLLAAGLLDELELMTYPVIAGKGARLFDDGEVLRRLELTACKHTRSGIVITTYRPGPVPA
ncbi:dihydrofolate reductase family protein [Nocardia cyriacigeorgica]|jgi:dihydrofolate reductase|uniref:dihydrofolate reductase family protein n=1 Tax=Nocardia cyriacigeorgica TaxID=135487 RepID=UPI000CE9F4DB|nr:dihydrofolate reductase family protein [Nocardia cyriacigeorgica]PPJ06406.1 riboflavin biosynthesis protein RibD [Nocardia cyriacigeorgica]